MDIREIHKKTLEYLYSHYLDDSILFMPRRRNTNGRLENGYYFIGTEDYLQVSFWDSRDWKERIHSIAFVILKDGTSFIEFSGRDNDEKADVLRYLVNHLSHQLGITFTELYNNKWKADYETDMYLQNLESFMLNEKLIIDEFLRTEGSNIIPFIEARKFEKAMNRIFEIDSSIEDEIKKKKLEGSITIRKSEYTMTLHHNNIQNQIFDLLINSNDYKSVKMEHNFVDIVTIDNNDLIRYYELKPTTAKKAIREAFGQLMEYSHYPGKNRADQLVVVSYAVPTADDINYLIQLREVYKIPLFYCYFNMNKRILSELY